LSKFSAVILDSFAGSGTTGHTILKMNQARGNRKFILVEMDKEVCSNITCNRLKAAVKEHNGGFCYADLGTTLFDSEGKIRDEVSFADLSRHVYFCETGEPLPKVSKSKSPLLGIHKGVAIYLLYNGILKDKTVNGGNVLTSKVLEDLPKHEGAKVIYGTACRLSNKRLVSEQIIFRQTPYEIRIK
jgi:site-specific DNA-methyltransferase (adenine-specific)/adenine-specific DNA-methyltransferase